MTEHDPVVMAAQASETPGGGRRLLQDKVTLGAVAVLGVLAVAAFVGPLLLPDITTALDLGSRLRPPAWQAGGSWANPLGTDPLGRDVASLLVAGARVSLVTGTVVVLLAGTLGTGLGVLAAYRRGWYEILIMRAVDSAVAFPGLLLALVVLAILGPSQTTLIVVLSALGWMVFARIVHDRVLELRETPYVEAAEAIGCRKTRVVVRHILPNLAGPVFTVATLEFARVVLAEASLSYLGMGIQPPSTSWGLLVAEGQRHIGRAWWLVTWPGLLMALTVLCVHLVGNHMRRDAASGVPRRRRALARARPRAAVPDARATATSAQPSGPLLSVADLSVDIVTRHGVVQAVRDVSFEIEAGQTVGIVGESGSGKTMSALAVMDLLPPGGTVTGGRMLWRGQPLGPHDAKALRGRRITMVFQDPVASLNPLMPIGRQMTEVLRKHGGLGRNDARDRAVELLDLVGIPSPRDRLGQYPSQLSGGMCQRVMIALALAPDPDLLVADEPTTAVDVTIQAQILDLLRRVQRELGTAVMLITHDLGVVAGTCSDVVVMKDGEVAERGGVHEVFHRPSAAYTSHLLSAIPRLDRPPVARL